MKKKKMKLRTKIKILSRAMTMEMREHKSSFIVYMVLRALVIIMFVLQLIERDYEAAFLCVLTMVLMLAPLFFQVQFKVELPTGLEITILCFIFCAEILGEISDYYIRFPFWDDVLHTINGFLTAAIGLAMVNILNKSERFYFQLSPLFVAIVTFTFSMTIGVLWEFFEFGMDHFFFLDMQKDTVVHHIGSVLLNPNNTQRPVQIQNITKTVVNGHNLGLGGYLDIGLIDTMQDLLVNFIGALVFSIIGYRYVKSQGENEMIRRFVPQLKKDQSDYLQQSVDEEKRLIQKAMETSKENEKKKEAKIPKGAGGMKKPEELEKPEEPKKPEDR